MKRASRKIRSHLRPSGWAFIVIAALVQVAAWNTGNNLLYVIAGSVLSFLLLSLVLTRWTLRALEVSREAPSSIHRGDSFGVTIELRNTTPLLQAVSLRVEHDPAENGAFTYLQRVPAEQSGLVRLTHTFPKRGVHRLIPVTISTGFPLGLFESRLAWDDHTEVVVYPRVMAIRPGVLEQMHGSGETPRIRQGDGDEYFSLRDYIFGDDMRHIVWRVSARVRKLVVRELEPSTSHNVFIILDSHAVDNVQDLAEHFEEAIELTASLALTFLNRFYDVAVITPEATVPLSQGNAQATKILDMLARIAPTPQDPNNAAWFDRQIHMRGGVCVFVSPDPAKWGRPSGFRNARVLDPRGLVRA